MPPFNPHETDINVRVSGSPGVRVTQTSMGGPTQLTRASSIPNHGPVRSVPIEVLERVCELLTSDFNVRPVESIIRDVSALLEPWF